MPLNPPVSMPPDIFAHSSPSLRSRPVSDGDRLVLGKPLGSGIYARAAAVGALTAHDAALLAAHAAQSNIAAIAMLDCLFGSHLKLEVGTEGFLQALQELLDMGPEGSAVLGGELDLQRLPLLPSALALVKRFSVTDGREYTRALEIALESSEISALQALLGDAQFHGGLLVACAPERLTEVLACFLQAGFPQAAIIGTVRAGSARVLLR